MWLMTPARSEQARDMCTDTEAQTAARAGSAVLMDARRRIPHPRKDKAARVGHPNRSGDRGWPTRHENAQSSEQGSIELQGEIRSIRSEIRMLATQVSGVPLKNAKAKTRKEHVEKDCPRCGKKIVYSQRTKANSVKAFACAECGCSLYSRQSDGAFLLRERKPTEEKLACPDCGFEGPLALAPSMVALLILNAPNAIRCIEPFVERKT